MSREKKAEIKAFHDDLRDIMDGSGTMKDTEIAKAFVTKGWRKQSEGEWIKDNTSKFEHRYNCSVCDFRHVGKPTPYCPNCGARMKGGE